MGEERVFVCVEVDEERDVASVGVRLDRDRVDAGGHGELLELCRFEGAEIENIDL